MAEKYNAFDDLSQINVSDYTQTKDTGIGRPLTYLSWAHAYREVKKRYPDMKYKVILHDNKPYIYDELTGYMVNTEVTIQGLTLPMWLPVLNGSNQALKSHDYEFVTAYGKKKTVKAATMADINTSIMRCLAKNLAMHGLGLYIYAGEDIPEGEAEEKKELTREEAVELAEKKIKLLSYFDRHKYTKEQLESIASSYGVKTVNELNLEQINHHIQFIESKGGNINE